jgi:hypothetical protein
VKTNNELAQEQLAFDKAVGKISCSLALSKRRIVQLQETKAFRFSTYFSNNSMTSRATRSKSTGHLL